MRVYRGHTLQDLILGGGRPGGPSEEHVPERRRSASRADRPVAQPAAQRRQALVRVLPRSGSPRCARWSLRRSLGLRRGPGRGARPAAPVVNGGAGLGLVICTGLVEAHGGRIPGRERRPRRWHPVHLHRAGCRADPRLRAGRRVTVGERQVT